MSLYKLNFPKTFDEYFHTLVVFAKRFGLDVEECESIVQDSFIALWKNRENFHDGLSVRVYLYTTVHGKVLNTLRRKKLEVVYSESLSEGEIEKGCMEIIIEEETRRLLYNAIHRLPEQVRQIILLNLDGKTNVEIAELLKMSVNTVKFHKKNAYKLLRKELGKYFYLIFPII